MNQITPTPESMHAMFESKIVLADLNHIAAAQSPAQIFFIRFEDHGLPRSVRLQPLNCSGWPST